jgi:DNA-binding MarR family transcriptional regulator
MHRISTRFGEFKRYNRRAGHWRIAWKSLSPKEQQSSYHRAVRAFDNGVRRSHPGTFSEFGSIQAALDRYQPRIERSRTSRWKLPPAIFGSVARTQILQLLAINGPMHVRQLARFRGTDSSSTFRAVNRLIEAGVVAKRQISRRVVSLDRSHRGYPALKGYLMKLNQSFPVPHLHIPRYRHGLPQGCDGHAVPDELTLFGQRAQTRTLLAIAAVERINLADIAKALQTTHNTVWHAVNGLERRGLIVSRRSGQDRIATMNRALPAYTEFHQYLKTLIATERPEYDDIKNLIGQRD